MKKKLKKSYSKEGEFASIVIRDATYTIMYRNRINLNDKQEILNLLTALEKFSGYSLMEILKEGLKIEWV